MGLDQRLEDFQRTGLHLSPWLVTVFLLGHDALKALEGCAAHGVTSFQPPLPSGTRSVLPLPKKSCSR